MTKILIVGSVCLALCIGALVLLKHFERRPNSILGKNTKVGKWLMVILFFPYSLLWLVFDSHVKKNAVSEEDRELLDKIRREREEESQRLAAERDMEAKRKKRINISAALAALDDIDDTK